MASTSKRYVLLCLSGFAVAVAVAPAAAAPSCGGFSVDSSPTRGHSQVLEGVAAVPGTNTAWAVGTFHDNDLALDQTLTELWDGSRWTQKPSPSPGQSDYDNDYLLGVAAIAADDVWAVGYSETRSGERTLVEHWDGTGWSVVPSPNVDTYSSLLAVAAVSPNDVWAVGHYLNTQRRTVRQETLAEHWDGIRWSVVPTPNIGRRDDNELVAVAAIPGTGQVIAVGYHQGGYAKALVEMWDGTTWNLLPVPPVGQQGGYLNGVSALSATEVWAVGFSIDRYGAYQGLTARWDGGAWTRFRMAPLPGDGYDPMLNAVAAVATDEVWTVGTYYNGNSSLLTLAELWDGSKWRLVTSENPGGTGLFAANVFNGVAAISATDVRGAGYWHLGDIYADPPHALIESWCP